MTGPVPTPGQTIGPFFGFALAHAGAAELVPPGRADAIRLHGRVLDGAGSPVPDALVELWQSDAAGVVVREPGSLTRDGFTFTGWGRAETDATGHYSFSTLEPAAPFFALTVFARGLTNRLFTRAYRPAAADDPFLATVEAERRSTLVASAEESGYRFDIRLQGEGETVFLAYPRH
ncbi:protocatechuate 3,4-dioxygenase subunit alpha [soil metagenome]